MKTYCVKNWEQDFETYETKKLTHLKWVPVPNKHDGLGFRKLAAQRNACELFAAWNLILQVASKGRRGTERGKLIRGSRALTASDLAVMTGFPALIFEKAFTFFASEDIGWLVVDGQEPTVLTGEVPARAGDAAVLAGDAAAEGKEGKEGREGKGKPDAKAITIDEAVSRAATHQVYSQLDVRKEASKAIVWCDANKRTFSWRMFVNWLNRELEKPTKPTPVGVIIPTAQRDWGRDIRGAKVEGREEFA